MLEMMSDAELNDALRSAEERMRELLNERHRRSLTHGGTQPATMGAAAKHAALSALRADRKSVLAFVAIAVIMVGVALVNALKTVVGP